MTTTPAYYVGQKDSTGHREVLAIENGKVCLSDTSASIRYMATRKWYKITSPTLARILAR